MSASNHRSTPGSDSAFSWNLPLSTRTFEQLLRFLIWQLLRFLLGIFESGYYPGCVVYIAQFFPDCACAHAASASRSRPRAPVDPWCCRLAC